MRKKLGILMLLLFFAFLIFAILEEIPYLTNAKKAEALRETYAEIPEDREDPYLSRQIDFEGLQQLNQDIVGWIYIPDTPIDYPVLKNGYDNEYLSQDYTGTYNTLGSIFMRASVNEDFSGKHTILYGHNLADNQMFGWLSEYADAGVKTKYPYIYIYLPNKILRGSVYSAYVCQDRTDTYRTQFPTMEEYAAWKNRTASLGAAEKQTFQSEPVLTLSTCTDRGDARFVVHSLLQTMEKEGQGRTPANNQ